MEFKANYRLASDFWDGLHREEVMIHHNDKTPVNIIK